MRVCGFVEPKFPDYEHLQARKRREILCYHENQLIISAPQVIFTGLTYKGYEEVAWDISGIRKSF